MARADEPGMVERGDSSQSGRSLLRQAVGVVNDGDERFAGAVIVEGLL